MTTFDLQQDTAGHLIGLYAANDPAQMNWAQNDRSTIWGTVTSKQLLTITVERYVQGDQFIETYTLTNDTDFDVYSQETDIGIALPLPDTYVTGKRALNQRCNVHLWCGGSASYVMVLRMDGSGPNLGAVLRRGSLQGYSINRDPNQGSNERGDFILHPENFHLHPGESYTLQLVWFWFAERADFQTQLRQFPGFLTVQAPQYTLFPGETVPVTIQGQGIDLTAVVLTLDGDPVTGTVRDGRLVYELIGKLTEGAHRLLVTSGNQTTWADFYQQPAFTDLVTRRVHFIVDHQQCHDEASVLNGAYLVYDNETHRQYYEHVNDLDAGRERIGMGVLLAYYLQTHEDAAVARSLTQYLQFVRTQLLDETTGEVFNDAPRNNDTHRLYNFPWMADLFLQVYHWRHQAADLDRAVQIMRAYFREGGDRHYSIDVPMGDLIETLHAANRPDDAAEMLAGCERLGAFILQHGQNYPAHEVNYEQSIVAPAAIYLLELYQLTGEERYRRGAAVQLRGLAAFHGDQPDFHLYGAAIRHWDGYWFGKRKLYGDTFSHYWSALSGIAFTAARPVFPDTVYPDPRAIFRNVLSMFFQDGSASCAFVYPMSVNGVRADYADPWANDQDWGMYFALKNQNITIAGK